MIRGNDMATGDGYVFLGNDGLYGSTVSNSSYAYQTSAINPAYFDSAATTACVDHWKTWTRIYRDELTASTNVVWRTWVDGGTQRFERRIRFSDELLAQQPPSYLEQQTNQMIAADRQRLQTDPVYQQQEAMAQQLIQQQQAAMQQQFNMAFDMAGNLIGEVAYLRGGQEAPHNVWEQQLRNYGLDEAAVLPADLSDGYKKIQENRKQAEKKAQKLLGELIGDRELAVYDETKRLFVKGKHYDYIVPAEGFVKAISKDKVIDLCIHLQDKDKMPHTDNVIALKMMIEADEGKVLKMANKHREISRKSWDWEQSGLKAACMGA